MTVSRTVSDMIFSLLLLDSTRNGGIHVARRRDREQKGSGSLSKNCRESPLRDAVILILFVGFEFGIGLNRRHFQGDQPGNQHCKIQLTS